MKLTSGQNDVALRMSRRYSSSPVQNELGAQDRRVRLVGYQRVLFLGAGALLLALLATAATLEPNPIGWGTHQQLGLPPCTIRAMLDVRCPACGMTTSWSHFVRGHWYRSLQANVGGALLALVATIAAPWVIVSGLRGFCWGGRLTENQVLYLAGTILSIVLLDWLVRWMVG